VNNDVYLELARMDFNHCQALHQLEWQGLKKYVCMYVYIYIYIYTRGCSSCC
jgi:hypothetical protein